MVSAPGKSLGRILIIIVFHLFEILNVFKIFYPKYFCTFEGTYFLFPLVFKISNILNIISH